MVMVRREKKKSTRQVEGKKEARERRRTIDRKSLDYNGMEAIEVESRETEVWMITGAKKCNFERRTGELMR